MSRTSDLLLGIDAGGTKIHAVVEDLHGTVLHDQIIVDAGWGDASFRHRAELIAAIARPFGNSLRAIGVGAHGCDSDTECADLAATVHGCVQESASVEVVNDAELLGLAHGTPDAVNVILGTGSIVVSRSVTGSAAYLGGWGWLVGDDGSAWGLVRNAVRYLTLSPLEDVDESFVRLLTARAGVETLRDLADVMQQTPAAGWASWADLVFRAARHGSAPAEAAIENGIRHTLSLVEQAIAHNPAASAVVLGGGVITHQQAYAERIRVGVTDRFNLPAHVMSLDPVRGGIALAHAIIDDVRSRCN